MNKYGSVRFPILKVFDSTKEADEWMEEEIKPYILKGWRKTDPAKIFVDDEMEKLFCVENLEDMYFNYMYFYAVKVYDPETHIREEYDKDNATRHYVGYLNYKIIRCLVRGDER